MVQTPQKSKSCTLAPKSFAELAWVREQARQNAVIAAAEGAASSDVFYSVQDIIARAAFAPNDLETFTDYAGNTLQLAMDITIDGAVYTVRCVKSDTGLNWSVCCPASRYHFAPVMIDAVKRRIEQNRAESAVVN